MEVKALRRQSDEFPLFEGEQVLEVNEEPDSMLLPQLSVDVEVVNDVDVIRKLSSGRNRIKEILDEKKESPVVEGTLLAIDLSTANRELVNSNITAFDINVMDCIYTLTTKNNTKVFTVEQIAQIMTGDSSKRFGKGQLDKIRYSVEKLSLTRLIFNPTKELREKHYIGAYEVEEYRENFITTKGLRLKNPKNGKLVLAYELKERMPLYRYAELCHKIITYDIRLLTMRGQGDLKYSDDIILIGRYLGKEIAKAQAGTTIRIPYEGEDGMFMELGFLNEDEDWKSRRKTLRQYVLDTLADYQAKNIVLDFSEYKDGNESNMRLPYSGVEIDISPDYNETIR